MFLEGLLQIILKLLAGLDQAFPVMYHSRAVLRITLLQSYERVVLCCTG
jgi:hypothetical protein